MYDISDQVLGQAKERLTNLKGNYKEDLRATQQTVDEAFSRISFYADLAQAVADADLVIEAIPEVAKIRCCGRYLATRCHDTSRFLIRYKLRKLASETAHQQGHCNRYVENSGNPFERCQYAGFSGKRHDIAVANRYYHRSVGFTSGCR